MRAIPCLIAFAASALVQIHPSLPEPGTLDGVGVNIYLSAPTLVY